jgi:vacuolar-type H+-ATPase subunit E/Vma4
MSETDKFTEDILANAKAKADSIIREAENETQRASDEAKATIARETEAIMRSARADAEAVKRRQISEARHRAKIREQHEKDKIMQDVLEKSKKRMLELARDETKYVPFLTRLIQDGVRELGDKTALIHLNENDTRNISHIEDRLSKATSGHDNVKLSWSKDPIQASGGAIISSQDGKIRIVNTLDQRFEALESKLLIEARKSLFGE